MNFFKKKGQVILSLSEGEITGSPEMLKKSLASVLPVDSSTQIKMTLLECRDIQVHCLSVIVAFALDLKDQGVKLTCIAPPALLGRLQEGQMSDLFFATEEGI